jgi:hypothetical protein
LQVSKTDQLEDASHDISDGAGRLDEPAAAADDRISAQSTEEQSDDKAQRPNQLLKEPLDRTGKKLRPGSHQRRKAVGEFIKHCRHERNHQGLDNQIPFPHPGLRG